MESDNASDISRRSMLHRTALVAGVATGGAVLGSLAASPAHAARPSRPDGAHLTLLGTSGGPPPMPGRSGISTALTVGGRTYIIDMGHGSFDQLDRAGIGLGEVDGIFATHLHSDHIADLFTLLWLRFGGLRGFGTIGHPMEVYGPGPAGALPIPNPPSRAVSTVHPENPTPGLHDFVAGSITAAAYDINIRIRIRDEAWPDIRDLVHTHEIELPEVRASATGVLAPPMDPFLVVETDSARVSAILVKHPPVFPSYAFRFDTDEGSVVFSGDTTVSENVVTLATGADVLVHEAIDLGYVKAQGFPPALAAHLAAAHTDVQKVGSIAERAGVHTLVLTHLVPGDVTAVSDRRWHQNAQRGFSGRVVVGRDLDVVQLRDARR